MKKIFFIVKKSLLQHKLSTVITILSVALAAALVMSVFSIRDQAESAFTGGPVGFDAVLGARGSQLQLVLNTVFHLETHRGIFPGKSTINLKKTAALNWLYLMQSEIITKATGLSVLRPSCLKGLNTLKEKPLSLRAVRFLTRNTGKP